VGASCGKLETGKRKFLKKHTKIRIDDNNPSIQSSLTYCYIKLGRNALFKKHEKKTPFKVIIIKFLHCTHTHSKSSQTPCKRFGPRLHIKSTHSSIRRKCSLRILRFLEIELQRLIFILPLPLLSSCRRG
jgi:hypothetical protein